MSFIHTISNPKKGLKSNILETDYIIYIFMLYFMFLGSELNSSGYLGGIFTLVMLFFSYYRLITLLKVFDKFRYIVSMIENIAGSVFWFLVLMILLIALGTNLELFSTKIDPEDLYQFDYSLQGYVDALDL